MKSQKLSIPKSDTSINRYSKAFFTFILLAAISQFAFADVITVNTNNDVVDGNTTSIANLIATPGADGMISLREAVHAANNTPGEDEIRFAAGTNGMVFVLDIGSMNEDLNMDGDLDLLDAAGLIVTG